MKKKWYVVTTTYEIKYERKGVLPTIEERLRAGAGALSGFSGEHGGYEIRYVDDSRKVVEAPTPDKSP